MTTKTCTWIGSGEGCTHDAMEGRSYCLHHYGLVYQEGSGVRRKKDQRRAAAVWDLENALNEAVQELEEEGYDIRADRWDAEVEVE